MSDDKNSNLIESEEKQLKILKISRNKSEINALLTKIGGQK